MDAWNHWLVRAWTRALTENIRLSFTDWIARHVHTGCLPHFVGTRARCWRNKVLLPRALATSHAPLCWCSFYDLERCIRVICSCSWCIFENANITISSTLRYRIWWTIPLRAFITWIVLTTSRDSDSVTLSLYGHMVFPSSWHWVLWQSHITNSAILFIFARTWSYCFKIFQLFVKTKFLVWYTHVYVIGESFDFIFARFLFCERSSFQKVPFAYFFAHFRPSQRSVVQLPAILIITWTRLLIRSPCVYFLTHTESWCKILDTIDTWIVVTRTSCGSVFEWINERLGSLSKTRTVSGVSSILIITWSWSSEFPIYKSLVNRLAPFWACGFVFCRHTIRVRSWYMIECLVIDKMCLSSGLAHRPRLWLWEFRHHFTKIN